MPKVVKKTSNETDFTSSYETHGVEFTSSSGDQSAGNCPFCEAENKFYVNRHTGQHDCKVCLPEGGNLVTFFRRIWEQLDKEKYNYTDLCKSRGIISSSTPAQWGVVESLNGEWIVPGFNGKGDIVQLYRYAKLHVKGEWKQKLIATKSSGADGGTEFHGICKRRTKSKADKVIICEGVWDAMVLSECIDSSFEIYAVPGCNIFLNNWTIYFTGKDVYFLYDNDYQDKNGRIPALVGLKRAASILYNSHSHPRSLHYLRWGNIDKYSTKSLPAGYDIRDHLTRADKLEDRRILWNGLLDKFVLVPEDWIEKKESVVKLSSSQCESWEQLVSYWKKAMCWPESGEYLDYGMTVAMACIISLASQGELLWIRLIAPPSSGKSILCEAISVAEDYVEPISDFNGLYSGFRSKSGKDCSLIAKLKNKIAVIKDANTIQEHKNRDVFLAQFRDAYDGAARFHRGNESGRSYEGHRFGMIWGCTNASKIDRSSLGERMLDCIILEKMDEDMEDEIGFAVAKRAFREAKTLANGQIESQMTPEMAEARKRTGGFINYLWQNAEELLGRVDCSDNNLRYIQRWASFISFMRSREWSSGSESFRELPFRLTSQLVRLATCIAAVLNKKNVDEYVMQLTRRVAFDTCKGTVLGICQELYNDKRINTEMALSIVLNVDQKDMGKLLRFLRGISVIESFVASNTTCWRLTKRVKGLYEFMFGLLPSVEAKIGGNNA